MNNKENKENKNRTDKKSSDKDFKKRDYKKKPDTRTERTTKDGQKTYKGKDERTSGTDFKKRDYKKKPDTRTERTTKDGQKTYKGKDERVFDKDSKKRDYKKRPDTRTESGSKEAFKGYKGKDEKVFDKDFKKRDYKKRPDTRTESGSKEAFKGYKGKDEKVFDKDFKKRDYKKRPDTRTEGTSKDGFKTYKGKDDRVPSKNYKKKDFKSTTDSAEDAGSKNLEKRLNKFIANAGICSRREADNLIEQGQVTVNGKIVTEMGFKLVKTDIVKIAGKKIHSDKTVYILLNKPKGTLATVSDDRGRKTVLDFFKNKVHERIYPVGRLDRDSTGVLLLTNDGDLTKQLTHPKYNKKKVYHVFLDKDLTNEDLKKISAGVVLEDGYMKFDTLAFPDPKSKKDIGVEIHSGRNRVIRRMFEHFGYEVMKLDRVYFAGLTKKDVKRGKWRFLTDKEVAALKKGTYE